MVFTSFSKYNLSVASTLWSQIKTIVKKSRKESCLSPGAERQGGSAGGRNQGSNPLSLLMRAGESGTWGALKTAVTAVYTNVQLV